MGRGTIQYLSFVVAISTIATSALGADVDARIARVGLFAGSKPLIRSGVWSLVEVELRSRADKPFDGEVRIDQPDRDGDVVTSVVPVALAPGADWRPYQVFFVPYDEEQAGNLRVRVFDAQGRMQHINNQFGAEVTELEPENKVMGIRADDFLIVDLSTPKRLPHVTWLDADRRGKGESENTRKVLSMPPADLPSRAIGLEAVDAITWDDADPSALTEHQSEALIEWVKAGGRLLITSSKNWQALMNSPIASLLPVTITGVSPVNELADFVELVQDEDYGKLLARRFEKQPVRRCTVKPNEGAIPIPSESESTERTVYRIFPGRGEVTFVGASLLQLMPASKKLLAAEQDSLDRSAAEGEDDFLRVASEKVTGRCLLSLPPMFESEGRSAYNIGLLTKTDLYARLRDTIGFESVGSAFLLFAILFAIAYTLAATTGSFWYMKRRSWQHHAWSAFAAVAIACSVLGTGMVWLLRGFTTKLWQTTFIDAHAGGDEAYATALFGVKTPDHTRLNLRLPPGAQIEPNAETCPIRPIPKGEQEMAESHFVAAEQYQSAKSGTSLIGVPLRATLKEFQGTWHGSLGSGIEARLIFQKNTGQGPENTLKYELEEGSYLYNNLGKTLHECMLIVLPPDTTEDYLGGRAIVAGYCFPLGDLAKSGDASKLDVKELRHRLFDEPGTAKAERRKTLPQLSDYLGEWRRRFTIAVADDNPNKTRVLAHGDEYTACLLLSMYNLLRPDSRNGLQLLRSQGRSLDCTNEITKKTALLVGWNDEPSPVVLERDLTALRPDKSRTIYRFIIPIEKK